MRIFKTRKDDLQESNERFLGVLEDSYYDSFGMPSGTCYSVSSYTSPYISYKQMVCSYCRQIIIINMSAIMLLVTSLECPCCGGTLMGEIQWNL